MMDWIPALGALFWLPLVLWLALFLVARFLAYPIALKRKICEGKTWCYVPARWSKSPVRRFFVRGILILLYLFSAVSFGCAVCFLLPLPAYAFFFFFLLALVFQKPFVNFAMTRVYRLEVNAYFLEYKRQDALYRKAGHPLSEEDLAGHSAWAFRNALGTAESEKRLFKLLKEMAKKEIESEKESDAYENA